MVQMARDIQRIRDHIYQVVDEAFEYLKSRLVHTQRDFHNGVTSTTSQMLHNSSDCFLVPKFIQTKLCFLSGAHVPQHERSPNNSGESPANIRERQEGLLRRLVAYRKQPVGEGLVLASDRFAMDNIEQRLSGKWGSYRMYEKWIQDAMKWQWQDIATQSHLREATISLEAVRHKCFD